MYSLFKLVASKPIVLVGAILAIFILVLLLSSAVGNVFTALGFNTKENLAIKLEKTNIELDKAATIIEENTKEYKLGKELDTITKDMVTRDIGIVSDIKKEEERVIAVINKAISTKTNKPTENTNSVVSDRPTLELTNSQVTALEIIKNRANSLKGVE